MTYSTNRQGRFLELADAEGNLERPLLADDWFAPGPSLSVRDGCLELDWLAFVKARRIVKAEPPMLERFARLGESGGNVEQAVLRYARRWGRLDLCEHQLPIDHGSTEVPLAFATTGGAIYTFLPGSDCRSLFWREPVATWVYWSRQAAALLGVLSHLRRSEPARSEDWSVLSEDAPWVAQQPVTQGLLRVRRDAGLWTAELVEGHVPLEAQRDVASGAIETWLRLAGVSLELRWPNGVPEIGFRGGGLLGALGLEIMLAAVDSSGWLMCPGCGRLHAPRKTRYRRRSYCATCRAGKVPQRRASQRSRAKKAADPAHREAERARVREWRRLRAVASASSVIGDTGDASDLEKPGVEAERR
jgi:hypothetical protein